MDKLILRHGAALKSKYGKAGLARIDAGLKALVTADRRRGIDTQVLSVDEAAAMKAQGLAPVGHMDPKALKVAIDGLASKLAPHYFLLLGAQDVLPLVPLANPAYTGDDGDSDKTVPSDLPYACEAPYGTDPARFQGPSRVVGRLPDIPGASKPDLLVQLIRAAARAKPLPREQFQQYFGLSAAEWQASTHLSLSNLFGQSGQLKLAPPQGPRWSKAELAPRMHFINCHGGDTSPEYLGQKGDDYPVAHRASLLRGRISAGTVIAAECCYGAQLYDPEDAGGHLGIALSYLADGATGFFGSTTIAYGPSEGNGSADLICQYFLQRVLAGASLGRAALEARQKFAGERTHLDPVDLKTLAQFYLLGDPSLQPVGFASHALAKTRAFKTAFAKVQDRGVRGLRRERLEREGLNLGRSLPLLRDSAQVPAAPVEKVLRAMAKESGLDIRQAQRRSYVLQAARQGAKMPARSIHMLKGRRANGQLVTLVATEQAGELLHVRRLHARGL